MYIILGITIFIFIGIYILLNKSKKNTTINLVVGNAIFTAAMGTG